MPRDSDSPRYRSRYQDSGDREGSSGRDSRRFDPRDYKTEGDARKASRRDGPYGYDEQERERERVRDRDRYDSARDRERDSDRRSGRDRDRDYGREGSSRAGPSRRSASPQSRSRRDSERPRSGSRSRSPEDKDKDKAKPNFKPSGLLAAETNTVQSADGKTKTVLKYNEPPEARKPVLGWRLYVFKGSEQVELLHVHRQSAYLFGRDRLAADIILDHPSCSKQHAAIQHRSIKEKDEYGGVKTVTKPFIIDLESTNGTMVNDETIPASRYYELKINDVIKFGDSTKEYVLLHDDAA